MITVSSAHSSLGSDPVRRVAFGNRDPANSSCVATRLVMSVCGTVVPCKSSHFNIATNTKEHLA